LLVPALAGCYPSLTWLPDSSGFVCTGGQEGTRLIHYDLATGKSNVLVKDTGAGTNWPAVSPDGKQLALGRLRLIPGKKGSTLQVIRYSLTGQELKTSPAFDWMEMDQTTPPGKTLPDRAMLPQLFWAPQGDKIVVSTPGYTAIYDVEKDRLVHAGNGWLLIFGTSAVRPDGAGFLLMKNVRAWVKRDDKPPVPDPGFVFVSWDGAEKPLTPPPLLVDREALEKEKGKDGADKLFALLNPYMVHSGWNGDVAQVSLAAQRLRYLTARGEATLDQIQPSLTDDGQPILKQYTFPGSGARVRMVETRKKDKKPSDTKIWVEFLKGGQKAPTVLVRQQGAIFVPSPNEKLLALRNWQEEATVLVVNDQGEVVARVPLDR
jgi:hypothetical protein